MITGIVVNSIAIGAPGLRLQWDNVLTMIYLFFLLPQNKPECEIEVA